MTETQKRIEAYKKALPEIRERVIAVALLFAMSMAMMTSATFAWLTISRAPEVTAVSTTVAANGNLEIALATGDGTIAPGESKVGDSSANEKQPVTRANITWGNLVNLSDPNYGLDNLVLRPAQLNAASLLDSPLYAAEYQSDGRIDRIASSFSFTSWVPSDGVVPGYFGLSTNLGVRAISSTKVSATGVFAQIFALKDAAEAANSNAVNKYIELTQNDGYMTSLAYIMGVFMTDRLNASQGDDNLTNPTVNKEDLGNLISMYTAFIEVFEMEAQAKADLLNLQLFIKKNSGSIEDYTPYTIESLLAGTTTANSLKAQGLTLNEFTRFKADYNLIKNDLEVLKKLNESGTVKWQGTKVTTDAYSTERSLKNVINSLVNLNTCTLDGTPIQNIGASNASGYLNKSCQAVITNGVLYEFEKRTGAEMHVGEKYNNGKGLKLEATVKRGISIDGKIYAIITTSAPQPSVFSTDLSSAMDTSNVNFEGTVEAEDTYGMAIDLWVRTNAPSSYLTLEGNVLTKTETVRSMGTDAEGNPVELYTLSGQEEVEVEETDSETGEVSTKTETVFYEIDVYKIVTTDDSGEETETWYNHSNYSEVSEKYLEDADPKPKMEEVITVIGYEGENRIWGSETLNNTMSSILSTDSTTQGSGSCYVYYADTPEDQANSLNLLKAFKVAFITEDEESEAGRLLAIAEMDTNMYYAESGRVTVPLKLSPTDSINFGTDASGNEKYGIVLLEKNVPQRITAIIYLDGTKLTNKEVLAASNIQGQLNIQFGTSQAMSPVKNEDLAKQELKVSASIDNTQFDYDTAVGDMISNIELNIAGYEPSEVTGFFIRKINDSQGSREEPMNFTKGEDGKWRAQYKFMYPGNYVLRSVEIDGISHDLQEEKSVVVTGFALNSLTVQDADESKKIKILSAEDYSTKKATLSFATNDPSKMPKSVQGRFISENNDIVNIPFKYNVTTGYWEGDATFRISGDYTLQYIVLDGEFTQLDPAYQYIADVTLGIRVEVYTNSPISFKYLPSEMTDDQKLLKMQAKITDNAGEEIPALSNVKLYYKARGSMQTMDADMTWNGTDYTGEFKTIGAGNWEFEKMIVLGNTISHASKAPVFTIIPSEPPEYAGFGLRTYQYVPNGGAYLNVYLNYANTATVDAVVENTTSHMTYTVTGVQYPESTNPEGSTAFMFILPSDTVKGKANVQDGNWEMKEIHIRGYYDANGNFVTAEKDESGKYIAPPMVIYMTDKKVGEKYNVTKAVQTVNVSIAADQSKDFGKDENGNVTGAFMDRHTVSKISVDIKDFEGEKIEGVSDVKLSFVYENNSQTYGGYTSTSLTNAIANFEIPLTADSTGTKFTQSTDVTLQYAGSWETTFSFNVGGTNTSYTYNGKGEKPVTHMPYFTVSSVAPTVRITEASYASANSQTAATFTDTSTTVYAHQYETTSTVCGQTFRYKAYHQPYVTLTLNGYGNATGATLTFSSTENSVLLYEKEEGTNAVSKYTWSDNGICNRWVGYWNSQTGDDDRTTAGTLTATTLILTHGGIEYSVAAPITINNPN